jgi:formate-dependent nitrite reductase membrane component NrfD
MAALAMLYGIVSGNGIWYPINLLAAGFFPASTTATMAQLSAFHLNVFLVAIPIHLLTSLLVGLLYGAMLPMLPHRPVLLGGFIAPLLWSGLIYGILGIVNPVLNQHIHWVWFVISQMGFGIVAGLVVSRTQKIPTTQRMPFALMMESSGMPEERRGEDKT